MVCKIITGMYAVCPSNITSEDKQVISQLCSSTDVFAMPFWRLWRLNLTSVTWTITIIIQIINYHTSNCVSLVILDHVFDKLKTIRFQAKHSSKNNQKLHEIYQWLVFSRKYTYLCQLMVIWFHNIILGKVN